MRSPLEDTMSASARDGIDTPIDESLCHIYRSDREISKILSIIMSRIGYCACEDLIDDISTFLRHELKSIECFFRVHISDDICDDIEFLWWDAYVSDWSFHKIGVLECWDVRVLEGRWVNSKILSLQHSKILFITRMSTEYASKWELTELVSDHIFCDEDGYMLLTIVHTECVSDEFWGDHTCARPCLDDTLTSWRIQCIYFFHHTKVDIWSFFEGASHILVISN